MGANPQAAGARVQSQTQRPPTDRFVVRINPNDLTQTTIIAAPAGRDRFARGPSLADMLPGRTHAGSATASIPVGAMEAVVRVLATEITYEEGGPAIPVRLDYSTNGSPWIDFIPDSSVQELQESDSGTISLETGVVEFRGRIAYPDFNAPIYSNEATTTDAEVITITNTDAELTLADLLAARGVQNPLGMQATIESKIPPEYLDNGEIVLPDGAILMFFELGPVNPQSPGYDFQDLMVLVDPLPTECPTAPSGFAGGSGTPGDPYLICSAAQLNNIRNHTSSSFRLIGDIELGGGEGAVNPTLTHNWDPIGNPVFPFAGTFDGDEFVIHGMMVDANQSLVGLFSAIGGSGSVTDLTLICASAIGNNEVGILAGLNFGTIIDVHVAGTVSGEDNLGGLVGTNAGSVTDCSSAANVERSASSVGIGGLAGKNTGTIQRSSASGVVGSNGNGDKVGGLVGDNAGEIIASFSIASATGDDFIGGLAGIQEIANASVIDCYASGTVSGSSIVGGLVGLIDDSIVENSYSNGSVSGTTTVGGLIGQQVGNSTDTSNYWDVQTSGQASSAAGVGKTTAEMQQIATFVGWDITPLGPSIWPIDEGNDYPRLPQANPPATGCTTEPSGFAGGSGTSVDPFLICSAAQLSNMRNHTSSNFRLISDILTTSSDGTANPTVTHNWDPIANPVFPFQGTLDGDGFTIHNLRVDASQSLVGLFSVLGGSATVTDLTLTCASAKGNDDVGILTGLNFGTITDVHVAGTVSGEDNLGGLVGSNAGSITDCSSAANIVTATTSNGVGGLAGLNTGTILTSFASGSVGSNGLGDQVGGLVGINSSEIRETSSIATVSGESLVGGLVGVQVDASATLVDCFAGGTVSGINGIGGLVGLLSESTIENTYAYGSISGSYDLGGLIGKIGVNVTDTSNYWDVQTSGQASSAAGVGKTTAEMQQIATFVGWDITPAGPSIWTIDEGNDYPRLGWE